MSARGFEWRSVGRDWRRKGLPLEAICAIGCVCLRALNGVRVSPLCSNFPRWLRNDPFCYLRADAAWTDISWRDVALPFHMMSSEALMPKVQVAQLSLRRHLRLRLARRRAKPMLSACFGRERRVAPRRGLCARLVFLAPRTSAPAHVAQRRISVCHGAARDGLRRRIEAAEASAA